MQKLNIKGFLANERTLLHWLSISVVVGAMSLSILNLSDQIMLASLFGIMTVGIMFNGLYMFLSRASMLVKREGDTSGFESMSSAYVVVAVVFVGVAVNFVLFLSRDRLTNMLGL